MSSRVRLSELEYRNRINKVIAVIWNEPGRAAHLAPTCPLLPDSLLFTFTASLQLSSANHWVEYIRRVRLVTACHALIHTHKTCDRDRPVSWL